MVPAVFFGVMLFGGVVVAFAIIAFSLFHMIFR
jgi:hypothetical protein